MLAYRRIEPSGLRISWAMPAAISPSACSATCFISRSTMAEISGSENCSSRTWIRTEWFGPSMIL